MKLLTGASGFVGTHLLKALIHEYGHQNVVALTSKPIADANYILHNNYQLDDNKSDFSKVTTIIHGGAFTPKSGKEADDLIKSNSNIYNTEKLLSCNFPSLKKIVYLSTLDVYDVADVITEDTATNPASLYGASKLYCERMITSWANSKNLESVILRIGHVYGPGEEAYQKIIPVAFQKVLHNQHLQIFGPGTEFRSFIYIADVVTAIVKSLTLATDVGVINIVGGTKISINNLLHKILEITNSTLAIDHIETTNAGRDLIFDNSKLLKYLLAKEIALDEGLKLEWDYLSKL